MKLNNSLKIQNSKLSHFIDDFFTHPSWDNLPKGFPHCNLSGLTIEEQRLFDGIKLAWQVNTRKGRISIYKSIIKHISISIIIIFSLLVTNKFMKQNDTTLVPSVNAATVSATLKRLGTGVGPVNVGEVVESTMSGLLHKK